MTTKTKVKSNGAHSHNGQLYDELLDISGQLKTGKTRDMENARKQLDSLLADKSVFGGQDGRVNDAEPLKDDPSELEPAVFPHEFLGTLANQAVETLIDYLKANGAPETVIMLFDMLPSLYGNEHKAKTEQMTQFENVLLVEDVTEALTAIVMLGGAFHSRDSSSPRREPVPWTVNPQMRSQLFRSIISQLSDSDVEELLAEAKRRMGNRSEQDVS